jgi:DNA-directed RNA polymerase specialized sigma24 family protein
MGKKRSDQAEVQSRWHQFIKGVEVDPALQSFFQRHRGVGEEPRTLFEAVGENLANSREEIRAQAFWILMKGMPELADILHERESRHPGWRSGTGEGQQVVDSGMDIVSFLYRNLVKEHQFETDQGKDPRPYVRMTARNWKIDAYRKESRLVSLDKPLNKEGATLGSTLATTLPDPTSVEDEVVNELYYEHGLQQLRTWNFLQDEELEWFAETYVAKNPFDSIAAQFDTPAREAARIRRRRSRARQKALERLESIIAWYINGIDWKGSAIKFFHVESDRHRGGLSKEDSAVNLRLVSARVSRQEAEKQLLGSWLWEWAQRAVYFRPWSDVVVYENSGLGVCPLTHKFDGSSGHLSLITLKIKSFEGKVHRKMPSFNIPDLELAIHEAWKFDLVPAILYNPFGGEIPDRFLVTLMSF